MNRNNKRIKKLNTIYFILIFDFYNNNIINNSEEVYKLFRVYSNIALDIPRLIYPSGGCPLPPEPQESSSFRKQQASSAFADFRFLSKHQNQ